MRFAILPLALLAAPVPVLASAPIPEGVTPLPAELGDRAMAAAGLGDCLPQDQSELYRSSELSSQLEWLYVYFEGRMAERPSFTAATLALCRVRLARAKGDAGEEMMRGLLLDLAALEGQGDPGFAWLVLEAASLFVEQGNGEAALALLRRHADLFSGQPALTRAQVLGQMAGALGNLDEAALDGVLQSTTVRDLLPDNPANHETLLLLLRFQAEQADKLEPGSERARAAWGALAAGAAGPSLYHRRFATLAWRELARHEARSGNFAAARDALDRSYAAAFAPGEQRSWPIGTLDLGLPSLNAEIAREQGAKLTELFPLQIVPGAEKPPKGSWFYYDFQLDFDDTDPARREAILTLYRDLWEARGMPDVIDRPFAPDIVQLASVAFEQAQSLNVDGAEDDAVFANALRQTGSAEERAALERFDMLRRRQDALLRRYALSDAVGGADPVLAELRAVSAELASLDEDIGWMLDGAAEGQPRWAALNPWYLALRQSFAKGLGEDFLLIVPAEGDIHVFAQGRRKGRDFAWHRVKGGEALVQPLVERLRCQLDEDSCTVAAIRALDAIEPSPLEQAGQAAFDRDAAWQLYDLLIRPVEPVLGKGADVFVVAKGAMGTLPLHLLVTAPPRAGEDWADYEAMRKTEWLGDRYAFTTLPSFNAFRPNRFKTLRNTSEDMLFAVASPAFTGSDSPGKLRSASFFAPVRDGVLADLSAIRRLAPLPGTMTEYRRLVQELQPPRHTALLGMDANEAAVRSSAELAQARTVLFATHGLLPRQNRGELAEPALVFTPPDKASRANDGLLTASEILSLRLRADWVILSACNTAAGAGGGEGLSALSAAFLRAGALQVLASHWPVFDEITPTLTTLTLRIGKDQPKIGPARALQQAMAAVRRGKGPRSQPVPGWQPHWAHPAAWAPFTVISNGDEAIVNDRFDLNRE
ncbi:MAG: CHAT domain-containing protein [Sphingomonadaceae bacterium]|nr:CHAT domain-containing protein [Sphingomonadaceae bacterium]